MVKYPKNWKIVQSISSCSILIKELKFPSPNDTFLNISVYCADYFHSLLVVTPLGTLSKTEWQSIYNYIFTRCTTKQMIASMVLHSSWLCGFYNIRKYTMVLHMFHHYNICKYFCFLQRWKKNIFLLINPLYYCRHCRLTLH